MKIPIFKLKFSNSEIRDFQSKVSQALKSDSISNGGFTKKFENEFAKINKSKYSIACSSGTAALQIAFEAINIKNFEVIVPTNTFFGTAIPVLKAGGKVVLCDNDFNSPEVSFLDIKRKVTKNTKAVCIVHVGGWIHKDILKIKRFCKRKNIYLVEDAAHAHFASQNKIFSGNFGDIGCFSFFPTKVMTTGEGGMIVTKNKKLYKKMLSLKNFGRSSNPLILSEIGMNFKISEFNSCLGLIELKRVKSRIKKRKKISELYQRKLLKKKFKVLINKNSNSSHYKCIVSSEIPYAKIKNNLKRYKIALTGKVWEVPLHKQKIFLKSKINLNSDFSNADEFSKKHFCPPNYPELSFSEVERICKILNNT